MENLARFCLLLSVTLVCGVIAAAQDGKCDLKLAQLPHAPELRGFHLGMTVEQFKERAPKLTLKPADALGFTAVNIYPAFEANVDKATLDGVRTISIEFIDGQIFSLWVNYDGSFKWKTLDELTAGVSEALKLPKAWQSKSRGQHRVCADFQITASMVGGTRALS